jgi:orotidine-5'-phosphate decarboxylase
MKASAGGRGHRKLAEDNDDQ